MIQLTSFFDGNLKEVVSPLFGVNYWIGFFVSFFILSTLFIFRGFYAKLSKFNTFRYAIGSFQLLLYVFYYVFHQLSGNITWKDYMPFQLCSILDLTSAFLMLCPSEKLFNSTFPLIGPVILAFLLPDASKRVFGPNNFFYYQYYLNHLIIFFSYFYLYFYGHVQYKPKIVLTSSFITIFAFVVFVFNIVFGTNYLFIGDVGFSFSPHPWYLSTGNWNPVIRFLFMWSVGMMFLFLFNYLINRFAPPFYLNAGSKVNKYYLKKNSLVHKISARVKRNKKTWKFIKSLKIRKFRK